MFRSILILTALFTFIGQSQAQAQNWAEAMFDELSHDFGCVPRGSLLTHSFRLVNNTKQPVHVANVRVSHNISTSARSLKTNLQPGEETVVVVTSDTSRFLNSKSVIIFVSFDQPQIEEARLWIYTISHENIIFSPKDGLAFGRVQTGMRHVRTMNVTFLGETKTDVTAITSESAYVQPSIKLLQFAEAKTIYEVTVRLREDTPVGKWNSDIWVKTSNPSIPRLRVPMTVEVEEEADAFRKVITRGVRVLPFR